MITNPPRLLIFNADFRFDILERLNDANPRWVNVTPLIHDRIKAEGKPLKYYTGILEALAQKKFIKIRLEALYDFEWRHHDAFDHFPLRVMVTLEGIDEYYRIRKMDADLANAEYLLKHHRRTDFFAWIFLIGFIISSFLALAKTFHLFGF